MRISDKYGSGDNNHNLSLGTAQDDTIFVQTTGLIRGGGGDDLFYFSQPGTFAADGGSGNDHFVVGNSGATATSPFGSMGNTITILTGSGSNTVEVQPHAGPIKLIVDRNAPTATAGTNLAQVRGYTTSQLATSWFSCDVL